MATDIKLIEQSVNHLKIDKERAKKVQDKLHNMNESVENTLKKLQTLIFKLRKKSRLKNCLPLTKNSKELLVTMRTY